MNAWVMLTATAVLGVDVGWQPIDSGGFEYIIQISPEQVQSLVDGNDITSDLPPLLRGVRTYRITVGSATLPRTGAPPLPADESETGLSGGQPSTPPPALPERLDPNEVAGAKPINEQGDDGSEDPPAQHATGYAQTAADQQSDDEQKAAPPKVQTNHPSSPQGDEEVSSARDAWDNQAVQATAPERPWWTLTLALMGLFGSLGLNGYLGWIFVQLRGRHRRLVVSRIQDAAFNSG